MGPLNLQVIEQAHGVCDHFQTVFLRFEGFAAFAVAAMVNGDDSPSMAPYCASLMKKMRIEVVIRSFHNEQLPSNSRMVQE